MKYPFVFVVMIGCAVSQVGCGDDGGGAAGTGGGAGSGGSKSCQKVGACGGTLTGEWKMTQLCVEQPGTSDDIKAICETAKLEIDSTTVSGTLSYKADMTFSQTSTLDTTATLVLPASCLKSGSKTFTCQELQDIFKADASAAQIACTSNSDGGCNCKNPVHEVTSNTGTYTTSGSTVTLTTAKDKGTAEYCVQGSKLYLHTTVSSDMTAGEFSPAGQLVLEKQ